jgi:release factor glutamine methyltransferase
VKIPGESSGRDDLDEIRGGRCDSLRSLAQWGAEYLRKRGVPNARNNAEWILCDAANCSRLQVYIGAPRSVPPGTGEKYVSNLKRRARREPLQYILGSTEFMSLPFRTPPGVFVPRPDTETLVEQLESQLRAMPLSPCLDVLDLCCGCGVVGISLAHRIPNLEVWAVDSSGRAVEATKKNALINGVEHRLHVVHEAAAPFLEAGTEGRIESIRLRPGVRPRFSAIACNPPYIATPDLPGLPPEVREHEPIEALDGGPDGLDFYRRIMPVLPERLVPGGIAAFEIGDTQGAAVREMMEDAGLTGVSITPDYAGRDRVVSGMRTQ